MERGVIIISFALRFAIEPKSTQRGVRVAEGARLESVYTREGIEGSNPSLSAKKTNFRNEIGFFMSLLGKLRHAFFLQSYAFYLK